MTRFRGTYPPDWSEMSALVKREAGHRCVRCGHPAGDRLVTLAAWYCGEGDERRRDLSACTADCTHERDGKLRILTVHHLDGDKANNRWWNLLALCQVCHLRIQAAVIPDRPWLFPHTPWFRPYVAGFYAWYYDRRELTRAEVLLELDALLALGQPWLYLPPSPPSLEESSHASG